MNTPVLSTRNWLMSMVFSARSFIRDFSTSLRSSANIGQSFLMVDVQVAQAVTRQSRPPGENLSRL